MEELGVWYRDGERDRAGRVVIPKVPRAAFRLISGAVARSGGRIGAFSLAGLYDRGIGTKPDWKLALFWYRRALRDVPQGAASNIATVYRDRCKFRAMLAWWLRAAKAGDGDAAADVGYCYQYGIGARKDAALARRFYRRAITSRDICELGREAALYYLAVVEIDAGRIKQAVPLLRRATKDKDYPQAMLLLGQIEAKGEIVPCRCRRDIDKRLPGHARCPLHPRR
jgi:TPR repeat protein